MYLRWTAQDPELRANNRYGEIPASDVEAWRWCRHDQWKFELLEFLHHLIST